MGNTQGVRHAARTTIAQVPRCCYTTVARCSNATHPDNATTCCRMNLAHADLRERVLHIRHVRTAGVHCVVHGYAMLWCTVLSVGVALIQCALCCVHLAGARAIRAWGQGQRVSGRGDRYKEPEGVGTGTRSQRASGQVQGARETGKGQ